MGHTDDNFYLNLHLRAGMAEPEVSIRYHRGDQGIDRVQALTVPDYFGLCAAASDIHSDLQFWAFAQADCPDLQLSLSASRTLRQILRFVAP